jgi:endonuclease/exonuclease/phosphatase family metal-dependent hydrolase
MRPGTGFSGRRELRRYIFVIAAAVCFMTLFASTRRSETGEPLKLKILTANIGNADIMNCGPKYFFKLCLVEWEKPIADGIAGISPDIVALQEVYDSKWCETKPPEKDPKKVCYKYKEMEQPHQVRRLLGPDYTIVCDGRADFECIGVKKNLGEVGNCPAGELCLEGAALTHEIPDGCDPNSVIFGIDLNVKGISMRIVNGHPAASDRSCRARTIERMFEGYKDTPPLALTNRPAIIMGDMNMDPYTGGQEREDVAIWQKYTGDGKPFHYLSGVAERRPPYPTDAGRSIDHVISNEAAGKCWTLGMATGTVRLDGLSVGKPAPEAPDHYAILCDVEITPK